MLESTWATGTAIAAASVAGLAVMALLGGPERASGMQAAALVMLHLSLAAGCTAAIAMSASRAGARLSDGRVVAVSLAVLLGVVSSGSVLAWAGLLSPGPLAHGMAPWMPAVWLGALTLIPMSLLSALLRAYRKESAA